MRKRIPNITTETLAAFAEYDSATVQNARALLDGYIDPQIDYTGPDLTELLPNPADNTKPVVAMWFDPATDRVFSEAIEPAVSSAGYEPIRIDKKNDYSGKIDDAIVAQLRKSRFVVADFTHGDDGARGSVYYEAGFAHALNLPVLCTAREGTEPHFDINHYPFIMWRDDSLNILETQLTNKILAIGQLGQGPRYAMK